MAEASSSLQPEGPRHDFESFWLSLKLDDYCVYRMYDSKDRLLYVGITRSLRSRVRAHYAEKLWIADVTRVEVDHAVSEVQAKEQEKRQIAELVPTYNVALVPSTSRKVTRLTNRERRVVTLAAIEQNSSSAVAKKHGISRETLCGWVREAKADPEGALREAQEELAFRRQVLELMAAT